MLQRFYTWPMKNQAWVWIIVKIRYFKYLDAKKLKKVEKSSLLYLSMKENKLIKHLSKKSFKIFEVKNLKFYRKLRGKIQYANHKEVKLSRISKLIINFCKLHSKCIGKTCLVLFKTAFYLKIFFLNSTIYAVSCKFFHPLFTITCSWMN